MASILKVIEGAAMGPVVGAIALPNIPLLEKFPGGFIGFGVMSGLTAGILYIFDSDKSLTGMDFIIPAVAVGAGTLFLGGERVLSVLTGFSLVAYGLAAISHRYSGRSKL